MTKYKEFIWLEPWYPIDENEELFSKELYREVGEQHPLFEVHVKAVARRQDCDDVLFELDNFNYRYAVVHLTWSQKRAIGNYPRSRLYKDMEEWAETSMSLDHRDFNCE